MSNRAITARIVGKLDSASPSIVSRIPSTELTWEERNPSSYSMDSERLVKELEEMKGELLNIKPQRRAHSKKAPQKYKTKSHDLAKKKLSSLKR